MAALAFEALSFTKDNVGSTNTHSLCSIWCYYREATYTPALDIRLE